jgi:hypothetical protein
MAKKIALTPSSIDALHKGLLTDLLTPGLGIEVLVSGKKRWRYRRQIAGTSSVAALYGQLFPAQTIAAAREWARGLNEKVEAGIDPREALREEKARAAMTVARAHALYMIAVGQGRASRAKRRNSPRTINDKLEIYNRDIAPKLAKRSIYEVTESDLIKLVEAKGKVAKATRCSPVDVAMRPSNSPSEPSRLTSRPASDFVTADEFADLARLPRRHSLHHTRGMQSPSRSVAIVGDGVTADGRI